MSGADYVITFNIRVAWWVYPYLQTLKFLCLALGTEPNFDRVGKFIMKHGVKLDVGK